MDRRQVIRWMIKALADAAETNTWSTVKGCSQIAGFCDSTWPKATDAKQILFKLVLVQLSIHLFPSHTACECILQQPPQAATHPPQ